MNKILLLIIIVALSLFTACNVDESLTGNSLKFTNPIKTCKMVDVPYQAIEEYKVNLKYEVVNAFKNTFLDGFDIWAKGVVSIRNVDTETDSFTVKQTFSTLNGASKTLSVIHYIMPGETTDFTSTYDINVGEDFNVNYQVIPGTKTMTRMVTKYKKEERCN